jgi:hypothetical protein
MTNKSHGRVGGACNHFKYSDKPKYQFVYSKDEPEDDLVEVRRIVDIIWLQLER